MFKRRRLKKGRKSHKKVISSHPASIMAIVTARGKRTYFGKNETEKIFDKSQRNPNVLSDFDACVEACDALAASSGRTSAEQSSNNDNFEPADCSVIVSPDGALLFLPKIEGIQESLKSSACDNTLSSNSSSNKSSFDEDTKSFDSKNDSTYQLGSDSHGPRSPTEELFPGDEYLSAIVIGNDVTPGGDKTINGFSSKGWNPHLITASIRQAVKTLEATASFVEELIVSQKNCAASTTQACDQLRDLLIIREDKDVLASENATASSTSIRSSSRNVQKANVKSQAGPLLFPGSTLHEALVAMDHYHSKVAEGNARRWRMASSTTAGLPSNDDGALPSVQIAAKKSGERAQRREQGILDMQLLLAESELILKTKKDEANALWGKVHKTEKEVNRRLEEMTRERSRLREQKRRKEENERQAAISVGTLESTVTQQEIWELVSQVAADMDGMSFAPTGLPEPKLTGPIDKSITPQKDSESDKFSNLHSSPGDMVDARTEIEEELGLNKMRISALEADEEVKDTSGALLNVLSVNDTTKRSARIAAEACLLSSANAQANCVRSLVQLERASIEERLRLIEQLERKVDVINVREDLNQFIEHDKSKVPLGTTRTGEDDDGGIASALAVLNSHSERMNGNGDEAETELSSFSGWGKDTMNNVVEREVLEGAVEELFKKEERASSEKLETSVQLIVKAVSEKSTRARSCRASTCYALNNHRGKSTQIFHQDQFDGLCKVLEAILTGCDREAADISNAKMCMMLSQTFYLIKEGDDSSDVVASDTRVQKCYPNVKVCNHAIWSDEDFWVQALFQCVMESLSHSGVMLRVRVKKSDASRKIKWHDLSLDERAEAASQVHAVVFAQLGALAHSMIEFGCTVEQAVAFVRRLSVRHQLPLSQRTMLLSHLTRDDKQDLKREI